MKKIHAVLIMGLLLASTAPVPAGAEEQVLALRMNNPNPVIDQGTVGSIRKVLGDAVAAGVKGDLSGLADNFTSDDQNRLGDLSKEQSLKNESELFQTNWRNRYGKKLDWTSKDNERNMFEPYQLSPGSDKKRIMATVPGSAGEPSFALQIYDDGTIFNAWRIDVSNTLSAAEMRSRLAEKLNALNENSASWPADQNEASRMVAARILSVFGVGRASNSAANFLDTESSR